MQSIRTRPVRARRFLFITLLVVIPAILLGCSKEFAERVRATTYPPDFNYIQDEKLESTMWQLAALVARLDEVLRQPGPKNNSKRRKVIDLLSQMKDATRSLGSGGWPSNHPIVSREIEGFRRELQSASRSVQADPPNFYLAGTISGACLHCHAPTR